MAKNFIDRFEYEAKPDPGYSPDPFEEVFIERSGYRTPGEQVAEMVRAGETLADWRAAAYPYPPEFEEQLTPTPVFADRLDVMDRFRILQKRRFEAAAALAAVAPPAESGVTAPASATKSEPVPAPGAPGVPVT